MSDNHRQELEDAIVRFAYSYQTIDKDLITNEIPEAKCFSQDEIEAMIFCEYHKKDKGIV